MTESTGKRGAQRLTLAYSALRSSEMDAMVCTYPSNILMLTGYWPVVGTSVVVATRNGKMAVLVPKDEEHLGKTGWVEDVRTYSPGSLENLEGPVETVVAPLRDLLRDLDVQSAVVGVEIAPIYEEATYSASFRFQSGIVSVLRRASRDVRVTSADEVIRRLRYALTPEEVGQVARASALGGDAYEAAKKAIKAGVREPDVSTEVSRTFELRGLADEGVQRCGAFAWCMSGPRSAQASGAFAQTSNRELQSGDLVLVHSNPYVDGYFADVTRTYSLGEPSPEARRMYDAIFAARRAALGTIRPGAKASAVDAAARVVIKEAGFGAYFTHGTGHSVGFSAISSEFPPRIHPASPDVLEVGCTFNVEPSIYIDGFGGIRHCDVVTVTPDGYQLLTPFHDDLESCII